MSYSEELALKVRSDLKRFKGLSEKKMFGGIVFMRRGSICVGVDGQDLIVRCDKEREAELLSRRDVRRFDKSGKPLVGWLLVGPTATKTPSLLRQWIDLAIVHNNRSDAD